MQLYRTIIGILLTSVTIFLNAVFGQTCWAYEREEDVEFKRQIRRKQRIVSPRSEHKQSRRYFIYKDPGTAAELSAKVPGLGQLYANRPDKGIAFFIADLTILSVSAWCYGRADYYDDYSDRYDLFYDKYSNSHLTYDEGYSKAKGYVAVGTIFLLGGVGVYIWNIFDAAETANQYNKQFKQFALEIKSTKNTEPYLALSKRF